MIHYNATELSQTMLFDQRSLPTPVASRALQLAVVEGMLCDTFRSNLGPVRYVSITCSPRQVAY